MRRGLRKQTPSIVEQGHTDDARIPASPASNRIRDRAHPRADHTRHAGATVEHYPHGLDDASDDTRHRSCPMAL